MELDRRTVAAMLASAGLVAPGAALAGAPRVFKSSIALESNRVLIAVGMNGKGPYIFMIDTGQYISMIRPDLARELKLPVQGYEGTRGIGGKGRPFALYLARDFVIGGGIRQSAVMLQDSFEFGYQQDIYGALASGILTANDTDLDFDAGELRIYPDGRGDRAGYVAVESEIPRPEQEGRGSRKIMATVMVEGHALRCELDTGSPNTLSVSQSIARKFGWWDRPYAPRRPLGIGGTGPIARTIRVDSIGIGGVRVERPTISALGNELTGEIDGILGLSVIRQFNLSIDVRGRKLWVQRSRQAGVEDRYGLSGLWLGDDASTITIEAVGTGSPAAKEGLRPGDRIVGDRRSVLAALNGPAGSVVRLKIERDGATREVALTLAPYL